MSVHSTARQIVCILAVGALFCTPFKSPALIVGEVQDLGTEYLYSYTVDNSQGSFDIWMWSLEFNFLPDWVMTETEVGGEVTVPTDWLAQEGIPNSAVATQDFLTFTADVLVGETVAGFSFVSAFPPGSVGYSQYGVTGDVFSGNVLGPTSVPDGGALVGLWACALLLLGGSHRILNSRKPGSTL